MIFKKEGDGEIGISNRCKNVMFKFLYVFVVMLFMISLKMVFVLAIDMNFNLEYEVINTSSDDIIISIVSPDEGEEYGLSLLDIEFRVYTNTLKNISCDISIDNYLVLNNIENDSLIYNNSFGLESDVEHNLLIECGDKSNYTETKVSEEIDFIVDYNAPELSLITPNDSMFTDSNYTLTFIVSDNYYNSVKCDVKIFDENGENLRTVSIPSVIVNQLSNVDFNNFLDGNYEWHVGCFDDSNNYGYSVNRSFTVNANNINMELDKNSYDLGESGVLTIESSNNTEVTLVITDPLSNISTIEYTNEFVKIIPYKFNNFGKYKFKAYVLKQGQQTEIEKYVNVLNPMKIKLNLDNNTAKVGESISMNVKVDNEISDLTYKWDFGDGKTATGLSVKHIYETEGVFEIKVEVIDEYGNKLSVEEDLDVFETYNLKLNVKNALNEPIRGAEVFFGKEKQITSISGEVNFENIYGKDDLIIKADTYEVFLIENYEIEKDKEITVSLKKEDIILETKDLEAKVTKEKQKNDNEINKNPDLIKISDLLNQIENKLDNIQIMDTENHKIAQYLGLESSLINAKDEIGQIFWDMKYLIQNEDTLSTSSYNAQKSEIEAKISNIKDKTLMFLYVSKDTSKDLDIEKKLIVDTTKKYLDIEKVDKSKGKSILTSNKAIKKQYGLSLSSSEVSLEYLSGKTKKITLFTYDILTELEKKHMLALLVFDDSLKNDNKVINMLTPSHKLNNTLYSVDIEKRKKIIFYVENGFDLENIDLILGYDYKNFDKNLVPAVTGFAFLGDIKMFDNNMITMEVLVIVLLVLGYLTYEFSLIKKIKKYLLLRDTQIKKIHDEILIMSKDLKELNLDSAATKYELIMGLYSKLPSDKKKVIKHLVDGIYFEYVIIQINESVKEVKGFIKKKELDLAQDRYDAIKDLYKQLPKQFRGVVFEKCKKVFSDLENLLSMTG